MYSFLIQQRIRQRCRRQLGYDVELPPLPPDATEEVPVSLVRRKYFVDCHHPKF